MIVDTSVLVAVLTAEPDSVRLADELTLAVRPAVSAATYLETSIVIDARRDPVISRRLDELLELADMEVVPVTREQAAIARAAYRDFGKGSGHAAKLNFGDCFAYALAKERSEPLLFKGDDFGHTDVVSVL